jgi:predicted N-acetyltransferase YhbS
MQPQIIDESQVTPELDAEIRQALCVCFPADAEVFSQTRQWHGSGPAYSALICDGGRVIAHVGVVDRVVAFGDVKARAAGIQNVFVRPEFRGQGLSDAVMRAAQSEAVRRGFDCGLLFCIPKLEAVYARTGWQTISNAVLRTDDDGVEKPLPGRNVAMLLPIRLVSPPPSVIHLMGNDW